MPSAFVTTVYVVCGALLAAAIPLHFRSGMMSSIVSRNVDFARFQHTFMAVFLLVMASDWIQGPYLYRLYEHYGFLEEQIAVLYVCGFASSMVFGPLLGNLADSSGRKKMSIAFCGIYLLAYLFLFSSNFYVLMLGRIFNGAATSLLLSVFESWMVSEHNRRGFPSEWLARTLALATFGNSVIAVVSGVAANIAADMMGHHPLRPFVLAILLLAAAAIVIKKTWPENLKSEYEVRKSNSFRVIANSPVLLSLGAIQSCFEASLYIFVFLWTASLDPRHIDAHPPLGVIFGAFMLAIIIGSYIFRILISQSVSVTRVLGMSLTAATIAMMVCAITTNRTVLLLAFVIFELSIGVFTPAIATLRGELVPEDYRAGVMNWFRVPLNLIVILFLFLVGKVSRNVLFGMCALLCALAYLSNEGLKRLLASSDKASGHSSSPGSDTPSSDGQGPSVSTSKAAIGASSLPGP